MKAHVLVICLLGYLLAVLFTALTLREFAVLLGFLLLVSLLFLSLDFIRLEPGPAPSFSSTAKICLTASAAQGRRRAKQAQKVWEQAAKTHAAAEPSPVPRSVRGPEAAYE